MPRRLVPQLTFIRSGDCDPSVRLDWERAVLDFVAGWDGSEWRTEPPDPRACSSFGFCLHEPDRRALPVADEPPRFRAKNFSTCARSPTARGSPIQANTRWEMLPSLQRNAIGTSELDPFRSSILGPWSPL